MSSGQIIPSTWKEHQTKFNVKQMEIHTKSAANAKPRFVLTRRPAGRKKERTKVHVLWRGNKAKHNGKNTLKQDGENTQTQNRKNMLEQDGERTQKQHGKTTHNLDGKATPNLDGENTLKHDGVDTEKRDDRKREHHDKITETLQISKAKSEPEKTVETTRWEPNKADDGKTPWWRQSRSEDRGWHREVGGNRRRERNVF